MGSYSEPNSEIELKNRRASASAFVVLHVYFERCNATYPSAEHDLSEEWYFSLVLPTDHGVGVGPVVEVVGKDCVAQVEERGAPADEGPPPSLPTDQAISGGHENARHGGQNETAGTQEREMDAS